MLPNKQKTLKSAVAEMSVFRIWRAICIACPYYTKFGIIVASNAFVIQMRKTIHSASTEQMVFCLLRRYPKPR